MKVGGHSLIPGISFSPSTVRNKDMSWPEEMSFIANSSKMDRHKGKMEDTGCSHWWILTLNY